MIAWIKGRVKRNRVRENNSKQPRRGVWDEKGREIFRNKIGMIEVVERGVQEEIERTTERVRRILEEDEEGDRKKVEAKKGW